MCPCLFLSFFPLFPLSEPYVAFGSEIHEGNETRREKRKGKLKYRFVFNNIFFSNPSAILFSFQIENEELDNAFLFYFLNDYILFLQIFYQKVRI